MSFPAAVTANAAIAHFEPVFDRGFKDQIVIALITLSTDNLTELEFRRMVPGDEVSFSSTRIKTHNPMTIENLGNHAFEIAKAGELFDPTGCVPVFAYGCTSGSAIISQERLEQELHRTVPGSKLTSPMTGAFKAFEKLGIRKLAILTPYPDDVTQVMIKALRTAGLEVVGAASFHIDNDFDVPDVSPESIIEAATVVTTADADALFIPCTGLRTSSVIATLESRLGKPVITAHQAMLWDALRLAGYQKPIHGFGRLLTV